MQAASLRGCAPLRMPASSLGLLQLAGSGEGRWADCQAFFQHRFRKKILQSAEGPDFQQFTFETLLRSNRASSRRGPAEQFFCVGDTLAFTLQENPEFPSSTHRLSRHHHASRASSEGGCMRVFNSLFFTLKQNIREGI